MRTAILALGLGLLLSACAATHYESPAIDSETHFLTMCASRCDEGLSCVCGTCTRECEAASECRELAEVASCSAPRARDKRACGSVLPASVCEAECNRDADCARVGSAHQCDQGVCRAGPLASSTCPARAAPECGAGQHLRTETDDEGCPRPVCAPDDICTLPFETSPICRADFPVYTFVAEHGRCELVGYGGCSATANNFGDEHACWDTCEQDNWGAACLQAWEPIEPDAGPVLGIDVDQALARIEGTHRADMVFPGGRTSPLVLTLNGAVAYYVDSFANANYALDNVPPPCEASVHVEAIAHFETDDGSFNERWSRLRFTLTSDGTARAEIHVKRPGVPSNDSENATLRGSYVPEIEPNTCDLFMAIPIVIGPDTFSGQISFLIANAACEDVVGTTAVGRGSPPGPSWLAAR